MTFIFLSLLELAIVGYMSRYTDFPSARRRTSRQNNRKNTATFIQASAIVSHAPYRTRVKSAVQSAGLHTLIVQLLVRYDERHISTVLYSVKCHDIAASVAEK